MKANLLHMPAEHVHRSKFLLTAVYQYLSVLQLRRQLREENAVLEDGHNASLCMNSEPKDTRNMRDIQHAQHKLVLLRRAAECADTAVMSSGNSHKQKHDQR